MFLISSLTSNGRDLHSNTHLNTVVSEKENDHPLESTKSRLTVPSAVPEKHSCADAEKALCRENQRVRFSFATTRKGPVNPMHHIPYAVKKHI